MKVLDESEWRARAAAHAQRLEPYVAPHLARRETRVKHPVHDFLFTYYSQRPAQLMRWHPGFGVALGGEATAYAQMKGYQAPPVAVSREYVASQRPLISSLHTLLAATASRPPTLGCFGLHEWAMVYRLTEDETRHRDWTLRLGAPGTDDVVESHRITCSHFDAFRFFTPPARGLNLLQPANDDRPSYEQPGCLHGGMDLYKHAFRLGPMISSDVVADAFELAWDIRILDMRAAPYDMTGTVLDPSGEEWSPVRIETPEGKREYADAQRIFAERGAPIRRRLIDECERLLDVAGD
ncbi:MAG TPA: 3-methyladenine DNA glycosylase [Nocardioides sp.]